MDLSNQPCFWRGCVGQETITTNEEDNVRSTQGRDVLKPEKLHVELVKEVDVDQHSKAKEEVAQVGNQDKGFSSGTITPRSKDQSKDDTGDLLLQMSQVSRMCLIISVIYRVFFLLVRPQK